MFLTIEYDGEESLPPKRAKNDTNWNVSPLKNTLTVSLPLLDNIKTEPDDSCVLPTDSIIDSAVRLRRKTTNIRVIICYLTCQILG